MNHLRMCKQATRRMKKNDSELKLALLVVVVTVSVVKYLDALTHTQLLHSVLFFSIIVFIPGFFSLLIHNLSLVLFLHLGLALYLSPYTLFSYILDIVCYLYCMFCLCAPDRSSPSPLRLFCIKHGGSSRHSILGM